MNGNRRVKLKPGASYRDLWRPEPKTATSDTTRVSTGDETTLDDWRLSLCAVLDALRPFPEARKAAEEAILRVAEERTR